MSKVSIEFNLNKDNENIWDEKRELHSMLKHTDMAIAIWDISQKLQEEIKYNESLTEKQFEVLDNFQTWFNSLIKEKELGFVFEN